MIEIGTIQKLKVTHKVAQQAYLGSGTSGKILLADSRLFPNVKVGDCIEVFVFVDSAGHLAATTKLPKAQVGEISYLTVVSVIQAGAFMDWGFSKDLLVPHSEQYQEMEVGKSYLVKLFLDDQHRVFGSAKIDKWVVEESVYFKVGQKVSLIIAEKTSLGYKAIINNSHWGLLYHNELYQPISQGKRLEGYIKRIRDDQKIDLCLQAPGYQKVESVTDLILAKLHANHGELNFTDKTPPDIIQNTFGISKKVFKQAIGALYKKKIISIETDGIKLVQKD